MPCGTTFVDAQGKAPRILSAEMPSHSLSLTQTYGPDTGRVARAVHLSLGGPFAAPLSAGIPASPALCKCALRFDLRFIGLQQHHNAFFRACQGRKCISNVFPKKVVVSFSFAQKIRNHDGFGLYKSGWRDLNSRPLEPHSSTLPSCATPRYFCADLSGTSGIITAYRAFVNTFF